MKSLKKVFPLLLCNLLIASFMGATTCVHAETEKSHAQKQTDFLTVSNSDLYKNNDFFMKLSFLSLNSELPEKYPEYQFGGMKKVSSPDPFFVSVYKFSFTNPIETTVTTTSSANISTTKKTTTKKVSTTKKKTKKTTTTAKKTVTTKKKNVTIATKTATTTKKTTTTTTTKKNTTIKKSTTSTTKKPTTTTKKPTTTTKKPTTTTKKTTTTKATTVGIGKYSQVIKVNSVSSNGICITASNISFSGSVSNVTITVTTPNGIKVSSSGKSKSVSANLNFYCAPGNYTVVVSGIGVKSANISYKTL